MTLSGLLLILFFLFLIPSFLLPKNRLKSYLLCAIPSALLLVVLFFFDLLFPSYEISEKIGQIFLPLWNFILKGYEELSHQEILHLSCTFTYLLFYFLSYLLCFLPMKIFYIGTNPNIHRPISTFSRIFQILFFLFSTYGVCLFFLINIRQILPISDGFLSPFFNWIYQIEA